MGGPYCRKPMETMFFPMKSRRGYSRISLKQITWILLLDSPKQLTGHKPLTGTVSMQCIQPQFSVSIWNLQNLGRIFAGLKVLTLKNCRHIMIIWYNVSSTPTKHQSISLYSWEKICSKDKASPEFRMRPQDTLLEPGASSELRWGHSALVFFFKQMC